MQGSKANAEGGCTAIMPTRDAGRVQAWRATAACATQS